MSHARHQRNLLLRYLRVRVGDRGVVIEGEKLTVEEQQVTEESATYRAEWVTNGLIKTKKGERQAINVQLQVSDKLRCRNIRCCLLIMPPTP